MAPSDFHSILTGIIILFEVALCNLGLEFGELRTPICTEYHVHSRYPKSFETATSYEVMRI